MTSLFPRLALLPAILLAHPAQAAPVTATTTGSARAQVVTPAQVQPLAHLRFGTMARPTTAGTVAIDENGTIVTTGGVTGNLVVPEPTPGRGPAMFRVRGDGARAFLLKLPNRIDISNGSATMRVDQFRANASTTGSTRFDGAGFFDLQVGGRLNVGANQALGNYSGTFNVTVTYQ